MLLIYMYIAAAVAKQYLWEEMPNKIEAGDRIREDSGVRQDVCPGAFDFLKIMTRYVVSL